MVKFNINNEPTARRILRSDVKNTFMNSIDYSSKFVKTDEEQRKVSTDKRTKKNQNLLSKGLKPKEGEKTVTRSTKKSVNVPLRDNGTTKVKRTIAVCSSEGSKTNGPIQRRAVIIRSPQKSKDDASDKGLKTEETNVRSSKKKGNILSNKGSKNDKGHLLRRTVTRSSKNSVDVPLSDKGSKSKVGQTPRNAADNFSNEIGSKTKKRITLDSSNKSCSKKKLNRFITEEGLPLVASASKKTVRSSLFITSSKFEEDENKSMLIGGFTENRSSRKPKRKLNLVSQVGLTNEERLKEYEFEVDENEPKQKKKRKKILKIKKVRPRKVKVVQFVTKLPIIELESPAVAHEIKDLTVMTKEALIVSSDLKIQPHSNYDNKENKDPVKPSKSDIKRMILTKVLTPTHSSILKERNNQVEPKPSTMRRIYPLQSSNSNNSFLPVLFENSNNSSVHNQPKFVPFSPVCTNNLLTSTPSHNSYESPYFHDISYSTPVKHHDSSSIKSNDSKDFNMSNCFGFDEPESFEEPLVSPIKPTKIVSAAKILKSSPVEEKENVPIQDIIKMLRFEINETEDETKNESLLNGMVPEPLLLLNEDSAPKCVFDPTVASDEPKKPPRRSYERVQRCRKKKRIICGRVEQDSEEEESDQEIEIKPVKPKPVKKKQKKEDEIAMENWIKQFNSQCQQVDGYDLCVE